jgi:hypothetical protein
VRDCLRAKNNGEIKKADLRRLFYQACSAYYFAAGAAAGADAAGAAAGADAASAAGAAAGAAAFPQADKDRANRTAAIRAENFIVFPSVDYKVTGVLGIFHIHSLQPLPMRGAAF